MRRGRVAPLAFEVEAVEEPGWEEGNGDEEDGSFAFAFTVADIAAATPAGSVVGADARRGIQRGQGFG